MLRDGRWLIVWIGVTGAGHLAIADQPGSPRVPGLERLRLASSTSEVAADEDDPRPVISVPRDPAVEGRVLLGELNCLSCHAASDELRGRVSTKQAPILDDVGSRVKIDWLRSYLQEAHAAKSGTTMPDVLHGFSPEKRAETVEALVHFLASTGRIQDVMRDAAAAGRGNVLFHKVGCLACHDSPDDGAPARATSVVLPNLSQKYSSTSLTAFLKETHKSRPSGRMPTFPLTDQQVRDVSHYLVKDVSVEPNVSFAVYHGGWNAIPDFATLKPVLQAACGGFDLSVAGRANHFGIRFQGHIHLAKAGKYTFHLGSDDGSRLLIDGQQIIDNDGVHPHVEKSHHAELAAGWHDVQVDYIQAGGEWTLTVDIEGHGLNRQPLGSLMTRERKAAPSTTPDFVVNPELAAKGKQHFTDLNCAACHTLHQDGQRLTSQQTAKSQVMLRPSEGCLAETPPGNVPHYRLSKAQRADLVAALTTPARESTSQTIHRMLLTFNCYACHARDGWGGAEESRNARFESLIPEMGDESRLPPTLTGIGDKLDEHWLRHLLEHSSDDRKVYMVTKMPKFGTANVGPLTALFIQADQQSPQETPPDFTEPDYRIKAAGRHLAGGAALSCIKCHDFREYPSTGIRAVSLTTMTRRLRPDWFRRYMLNPLEFRPGTRMPSPWPNGRASITDVLNADASLQIRAVWRYLADGDKAAIPVGLVRESIELKPTDAPIIYRNFIEGAGNRAIAVGYPEQVNLAFDANEFRLALIWHGPFLDASRHWTGRGEGKIAPLGDNLIDLGPHPSFARLGSVNDSWPTQTGREAGFRFLGYSLDKQQRPMFRYRFGEITIADHPEPMLKDGETFPGLRRTLQITGNGTDVWYRAAVASSIEDLGGNAYRIDNSWQMRLNSTDTPAIRESAGRRELLVPVKFTDGELTIVQEYRW